MFSGLAVSHPSESAPTIARLPRVVPRSLFSRALLIVIMPLLILQAVLAYVFYERHWDSVTRWLAVGFSGEVGLMVELLEAAKTEAAKSRVLDLARDHFDFAVSSRRARCSRRSKPAACSRARSTDAFRRPSRTRCAGRS